MIASLRGSVQAFGLDFVLLEVNGIGYKVFTTLSTMNELRIGNECFLSTTLVVREDSLTVFGFLASEDRDTFEVLLTLPKIGPKLALAVLNTYSATQLAQLVANKDEKALTKVPGIGAKVAARMLLDLESKLSKLMVLPPKENAESMAAVVSPTAQTVIIGLQGLGWTKLQAESAVESILQTEGDLSAGDLLKRALQELGG
ncbi:Holliday junction DNA helicase RuvA [Boudabousia tangfeifanii]|uniref:Holliday junction branch migration complex subunit RuvA n=1 Tax=Boudabousia tangfeifanii TaxID=1912795 RepID=A0A1D9MK48_9ACTO|nr:Holliday junction branch migration protein RuvA [Boudabousia tangfeifanii]AOZ72656.1 Holliday junction DNA helicase RuvA [Boudabousia tangfeifanii]